VFNTDRQRERERETHTQRQRERDRYIYIYIYIDGHIYTGDIVKTIAGLMFVVYVCVFNTDRYTVIDILFCCMCLENR